MASQNSQLTRHDLEAKIVKHSWQDEAFRKEFIADPAGVFVKYLNVPAASLPKVVVNEEAAGSWHIVIPAKPKHANELSEQDLERVAGGVVNPDFVKFALGLAGSGMILTGGAASVSASLMKGW
jgi:hypothetical protein